MTLQSQAEHPDHYTTKPAFSQIFALQIHKWNHKLKQLLKQTYSALLEPWHTETFLTLQIMSTFHYLLTLLSTVSINL